MGAQFGVHTRAAIPAAAVLMDGPHLGGKRPIRGGTAALRTGKPVVVAAAAHLQHLAHEHDRKEGDVVVDERIAHLRSVT
jgi:hypothetical protein